MLTVRLVALLASSSFAFQTPARTVTTDDPATQVTISVTAGTDQPTTVSATATPDDGDKAQIEALEKRVAELESQIAKFQDEEPAPSDPTAGSEISSFGGPVRVGVDETTDHAVSFGGPVEVDGEVNGDVVAFGGDVVVHSTGRVAGNAVSFGGRVDVEPGGTVLGDRVAFADDEAPTAAALPVTTAARPFAAPLEWAGTWLKDQVRRLVLLLSLAGAGVLVLGLFPDRVRLVSSSLEKHPFKYSIAGILLTVAGGTASLLFGITLVGLPISGLLLVAMAMAWLLGFVALCQTAGDVLPFPGRTRGRLLTFLAGIAILGAIGMIPYVGKVLLALTLFPCLGAAVATRYGGAGETA